MSVKAEALYTRHSANFGKIIASNLQKVPGLNSDSAQMLAIIYSACIIAEAIRSEYEDAEMEQKIPKDK